MKKIIINLTCLLIGMSLIGCGSGTVRTGPDIEPTASEETIAKEPNWYTHLEPLEGYIIAKGEGTSASKQGSRKKAINALITDFQQKTKVVTEGRSEDFFKEVGGDYDSNLKQQFEQIQTVIWNGVIENWEEVNSATIVEKTKDAQGKKSRIYRTYIVGRSDRLQADTRLLEKIKREKELLTAFEATKAYKKLQEDLEKYRKKLGM